MYQIIEYLGRAHNITSEGLFRKHGNLKKQQALKERLNKVGLRLTVLYKSPGPLSNVQQEKMITFGQSAPIYE